MAQLEKFILGLVTDLTSLKYFSPFSPMLFVVGSLFLVIAFQQEVPELDQTNLSVKQAEYFRRLLNEFC